MLTCSRHATHESTGENNPGRPVSASTIRQVRRRQILDSRGRPTMEVDVALAGGATAAAVTGWPARTVPSTPTRCIAMVEGWVARYPVASIEDALAEEDWDGWRALTARLGARVQLVGDDFFTTHHARLARGIAGGIGNGVLVKLNQNDTLTGTLDVIAQAKAGGYATSVSARSGETEDPFIADLAVGAAAGQIKIGSLRTSSTVGKYNQLLRIEAEGGAAFAGLGVLAGSR